MTFATIRGSGGLRALALDSLPRRFFALGCTAVLAALGPGCTDDTTPGDRAPTVSDDPSIVAAYRGGEVHRSEFDTFQEQKPAEEAQVAETDETDWRASNISQIVVHKILEEEIATDDPNPAIQEAVQQSQVSIVLAAMEEELGWNRLPISLEEMRAQYDSHPEQYVDPRMARVQHIFLRAEDAVLDPDERSTYRRRLEEIRQQILSGADFTEMARRHSQSEDAIRGGMMTLKEGARVFPDFAEAVWALELEEVSEIVDTPTGFQLLKLKEILPPVHREFENVRDFVRRRTVAEKLSATQDDFLREAGERHGLEKHYEGLADPFVSQDEILLAAGDVRYTFRDLSAELPPTLRAHLHAAYFPKVHEFLDQVARNLLLLKEAERLGLAQREDVAARIEAGARQVRYQFGLERRMQRKVAEVPEEEIREFFQQNEKRFQTVRRQDLDVIMIRHQPDEPFWATLRRAEDLVERIRAGEDFAELARVHSSHYSAVNGGRMEGLTDDALGQLVAARATFRAELKKLAVGEVSDPMVAEIYDTDHLRYERTGVVIARIVKVYPAGQVQYEAVKDNARKHYLGRYYQRFEAEVRQEILESADIEIYFDNLPPI
jgi:peptidyl-prolyl cis-trans isomerase C